MGFFRIFRKSRYHLNPSHFQYSCISPFSDPTYFAFFSSGYPLYHHNFCSIVSNLSLLSSVSNGSRSVLRSGVVSHGSDVCRNNCLGLTCNFRLYSSAVAFDVNKRASGKKVGTSGGNEVSPTLIKDITDIVKNDGSDMEARLDLIGSNLSKWSVIATLGALNETRVPALRYFEWVRDVHPRYIRNCDICSLVLDNCGRLGDHSTMLSLLKEFRARKICLSGMAFGFLNISDSTVEAAKVSIEGVVRLLNEVGGSCYNSGIHSLIAMLCSSDLVDLAKYVIDITEMKAAYYSVLVKHMCVKGQLEGARELLEEMRQLGCVPDSTAYNYLISNLCVQGRLDEACSVPYEMIDRGCSPDQVTFEILINFTCKYGRSDDAVFLFNKMVSLGIRPRHLTHSAFIRGYVSAKRFDEAYRYAVEAAEKDIGSSQQIYNVLASLHIKHGDLLVAHKLLMELIEKRVKPKHSVFRRVVNRLHKTGRSEIAKSLDARYSSLAQELTQNSG